MRVLGQVILKKYETSRRKYKKNIPDTDQAEFLDMTQSRFHKRTG